MTDTDIVVITFGRFNPPHKGHGLVFDKMTELSEDLTADKKIFLSHSCDPKRNPLGYKEKIKWVCEMFPQHAESVESTELTTIIQIAQRLNEEYKNLVLVLGEDRAADFQNTLDKYNGIEYQYNTINVYSAGSRDGKTALSKISASNMRKTIVENDYNQFKRGLPKSLSDEQSNKLFETLRNKMGVAPPHMTFREFIDVFNEQDMKKRQKIIESYRKR